MTLLVATVPKEIFPLPSVIKAWPLVPSLKFNWVTPTELFGTLVKYEPKSLIWLSVILNDAWCWVTAEAGTLASGILAQVTELLKLFVSVKEVIASQLEPS